VINNAVNKTQEEIRHIHNKTDNLFNAVICVNQFSQAENKANIYKIYAEIRIRHLFTQMCIYDG